MARESCYVEKLASVTPGVQFDAVSFNVAVMTVPGGSGCVTLLKPLV